jgi:hypothetical protein
VGGYVLAVAVSVVVLALEVSLMGPTSRRSWASC